MLVCPCSLTHTAKVCRYLQDTWQTASPNILLLWKYTYFRVVFEEYFYWVQNSRMAVIYFSTLKMLFHSLLFIVFGFWCSQLRIHQFFSSFSPPRQSLLLCTLQLLSMNLDMANTSWGKRLQNIIWNQPLGLCFYPVPFPTQGL